MKKNSRNRLIDEHLRVYGDCAVVSLIFDFFAISILWTSAIVAFYYKTLEINAKNILLFCFLTILYLIISFTINYRILFLSYIDKIQKNVVTEIVTPIEIKNQLIFREYGITNNPSIFFNKNLNVQKYKIIFIKQNKKKAFVRLIMSNIKYHKTCINIINSSKINKITITYYKHSKLLIAISLPKDKKYSLEEEQSVLNFNRTI